MSYNFGTIVGDRSRTGVRQRLDRGQSERYEVQTNKNIENAMKHNNQIGLYRRRYRVYIQEVRKQRAGVETDIGVRREERSNKHEVKSTHDTRA